jgi:hypothetical protein
MKPAVLPVLVAAALALSAPALAQDCPVLHEFSPYGVDGCDLQRARAGDPDAQLILIDQVLATRDPVSWPRQGLIWALLDNGAAQGDPRFLEARVAVYAKLQDMLPTLRLRYDSYTDQTSANPDYMQEKATHDYWLARYQAAGGDAGLLAMREAALGGGSVDVVPAIIEALQHQTPTPATTARLLSLLEQAQSIEGGQADATLGILHEDGIWVPRDMARALAYYRTGWEKGSGLAGYHLARHQLPGGAAPENRDAAFDILQAVKGRLLEGLRAGTPDLDALRMVSDLLGPVAFARAADLARGLDGPADEQRIFDAYLIAAQAGHQKSALAIAYMYRNGRPYESLEWEERWFEQAASCDAESLAPPRSFDPDLCATARDELQTTARRIEDREAEEIRRVHDVYGAIGLALWAGLNGLEFDHDAQYQPPDFGGGPAMETAASLVWLNKW